MSYVTGPGTDWLHHQNTAEALATAVQVRTSTTSPLQRKPPCLSLSCLASLATLLITVGILESDAWDHKSGMLVCHFTRVKAEDPSVDSKALTTMDLHCACLSGSHAHFWLLTGLPHTLAPHYLRCSAFPLR